MNIRKISAAFSEAVIVAAVAAAAYWSFALNAPTTVAATPKVHVPAISIVSPQFSAETPP